MRARWRYRLLTALGAFALMLTVANAVLFAANRSAQAALGQRQQYVQQSVALEALYQEIVKALAEAGVRGNDQQALRLLAAEGISVTTTPPPSPPAGVRQ